MNDGDFRPGNMVRLTRTWRDGAPTTVVVGVVADWAGLGERGGCLLLRDVPLGREGYWAAPSSDVNQVTALELLAEAKGTQA